MTEVVDRVVAALNRGDIDEFVSCFAADATVEDGDEQVLACGHDELRSHYGSMFEATPGLRVDVISRTTAGDFVLQEESVVGRTRHEQRIAVYLIEDGLIARERPLRR